MRFCWDDNLGEPITGKSKEQLPLATEHLDPSYRLDRIILPMAPMEVELLSGLPVFQERPVAVLVEGDLQFFAGIHDDGALPRDGLPDGFSGDE
jgi:hypothetical protein